MFFEIWNPHLVFLLRELEMDDGRILPLNCWQVAGCQDSSQEPNSEGSGLEVNVVHPQTLIMSKCEKEGFLEAAFMRMSEVEIRGWGRGTCTSTSTLALDDEVYNWKWSKDTVKWQKYSRYFVNISITRPTKLLIYSVTISKWVFRTRFTISFLGLDNRFFIPTETNSV